MRRRALHRLHRRGLAAVTVVAFSLVAPPALAVWAALRAGTSEPCATCTARQGLTRRSDLTGLNLSRVPTVFIECGSLGYPRH